jgi:uncharacterized membrane protein YphA (DoxX/SURF4 family)
MGNKTADAMRNHSPRKFFLADGKKAIKGIVGKWLWLPSFLARMVVGIFFIQTGLSQLHDLNHSKDILNFFWSAIRFEYRWLPFFPVVELVGGACVLLGCLTRLSAVLLFGIMVVSFLDTRFRGLAGVSIFDFQEFIVMALLAGLCAAGAGSASLDRFLFKHNAPKQTDRRPLSYDAKSRP